MKRKSSIAKKKPEEVRVRGIVDLIDPPSPMVQPTEPDPGPGPEPEPLRQPEGEPELLRDRPIDIDTHLAKALEIATAECARLAEKGSALAEELEGVNEELLNHEARVRELEGVLEQIDDLTGLAVRREEDPTVGPNEVLRSAGEAATKDGGGKS